MTGLKVAMAKGRQKPPLPLAGLKLKDLRLPEPRIIGLLARPLVSIS
jgi:hypothetical protein